MNFAKEILDAIEIIVKQAVEDNTTKIYTGVCQSVSSDGMCELNINGKTNAVKYYGGTPKISEVYRVFVPFGNMSAAFIIVPGEAEESSSDITSYTQLTDLPKINNITLNGNKTSTDLGLYGTNNIPPYPVTSVNGKTGEVIIDVGGSDVKSVNGKTGVVVLNKSDIGLSEVDNVQQYSINNPPPYPVSKVNGKTGNVELTASDIGALPDTTVIPTVNDATLTIRRNGTSIGTFTANASTNKTVNIIVPTNNNQLTNGAGYITSSDAPVQSVNSKTGAVVLTQDDIGDGTTYVRTHNDFTDALKQQINTNEDNIAMIDSDVGALETDMSKAKSDITTLTTALNSKQNTITGAGSTITENNLTANRALISNSSGKVAVSDITATELGYLDGATSNIQSQINNKANTSVLPNNSDIMQTKFRIAKQGNTGSAPQYYRLVKFPINNSGNYASAIISGRIGGWANDGISYINAVAWNRGYPGIALFSAMASNNVSQPWSYCDLIIYTEEDNSATLYLKTNSYYTFDVDVEVYQAGCDIIYDGTPIDVPTGTAIAYASSSYKRAEISQGKLYIAGNEAALLSNIPTQLSDLNNDVGFITANDIPVKSVNNKTGDVTLSAADVGALSTAGGTLTGNLTGKYLTGTWLQTTSTSNLNAIPNKYAVIDGSGWIYYRTKDEMISDLGIDSGGAVQSVNGKTGEVVLTASDVGAVSTSNVTQTLGSSTDKVPSEKAVANAIASAGGGDMTKAVYDPTGAVANAGGIPAYVSENGSGKIDAIKVNNVEQTITNKTVNIDVPTNTSDLTNDNNFITSAQAPVQSVDGATGTVVLNDVKYTTQTLTDTQKAQARTNIGAGTSSFSGSYNDLSNKPTIPTVNNGVLTIQKNGTNVVTFGANNSANVTANITVPTDKSDIGLGNVDNVKQYSASNPPPYPVTSVNGMTGDVVVSTGGGGGVDIVLSAEQPTTQNKGDFWYEVV